MIIVLAFFLANGILPNHSDNHVNDDWVGICAHSLSSDEANLVSQTGIGWIRIDVSGDFGQSVANAKAYNLRVLGILDSWMFNQSIVFSLDEWRSNVTYYVSQYADSVDAWEIWNEPTSTRYPLLNLSLSGPSWQENMSRVVNFYYSMAQTAMPIIRQYDPSAKILLFGGLNLYSADEPNLMLDKEFARQLAAMNIGQYGNAMSVHAYPWGQDGKVVWENYNQSLTFYKGLFNDSLEVWITETGKPVEESGVSGQAQFMKDALGYFRNQGNVTRLFWYSLVDNAQDSGSFGLIGNGTARISFNALQKELTTVILFTRAQLPLRLFL